MIAYNTGDTWGKKAIIPVFQMQQLRLRRLNDLPRVTQRSGGGDGEPRSPSQPLTAGLSPYQLFLGFPSQTLLEAAET